MRKKLLLFSMLFLTFMLVIFPSLVLAKQQTCKMRMVTDNYALCGQIHKIENVLCSGGKSAATGQTVVAAFVDESGVPLDGLFTKSSVVSCTQRDYVCALPCEFETLCRRGGDGPTLNRGGIPDRSDCIEFKLNVNSKTTSALFEEFSSINTQIENSEGEFKLPVNLRDIFSSSIVEVNVILNNGETESYGIVARGNTVVDVSKGTLARAEIRVVLSEQTLDNILLAEIKSDAIVQAIDDEEITYEALTFGSKIKVGVSIFISWIISSFKAIINFVVELFS